MSRSVRLSDGAERDLSRLTIFLLRSSGSVDVARRATEAIIAAVESLADLPGRGRRRSKRFRELPVIFGRHGYVLRYRISGDTVLVTRIFHAREVR